MQVVFRLFTETQQISLNIIIILDPNERKIASKKKLQKWEEKKPQCQTVQKEKLHFKRKKP